MSDSHSIATPAVHDVTVRDATDLPRHVLVADPNDSSRARRRSQLCESGYLVTLARTSFEAIVKACCQLPDLVVLDDSLGNLEVEETARLLATCPVTAHIPVVRLGSGRRLPQRILTSLQRATV